MATPKPVQYPNLVDSMEKLADVHADIHVAVQTHAANHVNALHAKRSSLQLKHAAQKTLEGK